MSKQLEKYIVKKRKSREDAPKWSHEERMSFVKLRREARQHGTVLAHAGRGGIPPSFVLAIMRRDDYRCKVHGDRGEGHYGGITLHHKGGIVESDWLSKKGHKLELNNLVTLCSKAHDRLHTRARAAGTDSSQVTPEGDKNAAEKG